MVKQLMYFNYEYINVKDTVQIYSGIPGERANVFWVGLNSELNRIFA